LELSGSHVPVAGEAFEIIKPESISPSFTGTFSGLGGGSTFEHNGSLLQIAYGQTYQGDGPNVVLTTLLGPNRATWTGAVDSDWYNPDNWDAGTLPTALDDVWIKSGTNPAVLPSGEVTVSSLLLLSSGNLTIDEGATLTLGGGTAGLVAHNGSLAINGDLIVQGNTKGNQTIGFNITIGETGFLSFLGASNDVVLEKKLTCNGQLILDGGAGLVIEDNGNLTVSATGVASITGTTGTGIFLDDASTTIAGQLTITESTEDGLYAQETSNVIVSGTGTLMVTNSGGDGVYLDGNNTDVLTNNGVLVITGSDDEALAGGGIVDNRGGSTFRGSGIIGNDIELYSAAHATLEQEWRLCAWSCNPIASSSQ
ncbi:MAG: right-handed parallel beta-helix repeat-containing protein, partial [Bacteroidota bacterium]